MTPERWKQVSQLYEAARACPADQRAAFLAAHCGTDSMLRDEVESLLNQPTSPEWLAQITSTLLEHVSHHGTTSTAQPEQIGFFRVIGQLGEGGMGRVYDAVDTRLGRRVALKTIREDIVGNARARDRFWREARAAATVNHPNICQIYEVGEAGQQLFLAMERLEGESLDARLRRGPIPVAEALRLCLDVLAGLDALHVRGIVHRDLKPANMFVTRYGLKLLDFGLARPAHDADAETQLALTQPGTIIGTPKYMAPEQIRGGPADARTDLFATGAILYEMLAGRAAFEGASALALADKILRTEPPMLAGSPQVAGADRVIHRALAKDPAARYASASAMADSLRAVLASRDDEPRPARPLTRLIVLPFRWLRADDEFAFLTFSLADAITNSLSTLESIVIRSPLAAARFAADVPDLSAIAREADVDVMLSGTILRAGDRLRVSAELVDTPGGTLRWSYSCQVQVDDIFQLQDDLSRHIINSLSLPLTGTERAALAHDVPSSARAYEFYLRGNQLSHELSTAAVARDLYLQSVQEDPHYAPAWGQLGRVYRFMSKHQGDSDQASVALAESALNRALALNPDLPIAHRFSAEIEVDRGRALDAMVRLLRRASSRSTAPDIFAALVTPCRYCGLLQASAAAHDEARRLDPNVRTSVLHTRFASRDYLRGIAESQSSSARAEWIAKAMAGHPEAALECRRAAERARAAALPWLAAIMELWGESIDGRGSPEALCSASEAAFRLPADLDGWFYLSAGLARFGGDLGADRAVQGFADLVSRGFFPYTTFLTHHWLDGLRHRSDFRSVMQRAKARNEEARRAFLDAGGEALLGAGTGE